MGLDSTAELLFKINADSSDATGNIAAFRGLMTKDLDDLAAEFSQWSEKVLGSLATVQGAMIASGAVLATGILAAAAACKQATDSYVEYVSEIAHGSKVTGIAVETMSGLHLAAEESHVSFESLVKGIARFQAEVVKANTTEKGSIELAGKLHVSRQQLRDGEKQIEPLLESVANRFRDLGAGTNSAALARELFSRNGTELLPVLLQGGQALKDAAKNAKDWGLAIGTDDVEAMYRYKAAGDAMIILQQQLNKQIGKVSLPLMQALKLEWLAFLEVISGKGIAAGGFLASVDATADMLQKRVMKIAAELAKMKGDDPGGDAPKVAKLREEFSGLASILETVKERMASSLGGEAHITEEIDHLNHQVGEATKKFHELQKEGKLSGEAVAQGTKDLAALPGAIAALSTQLLAKATADRNNVFDQFADDLRKRIAEAGPKTLAAEQQIWAQEIAALQTHLAKEKDLTADQRAAINALIERLDAAGAAKRRLAAVEATDEAHADLLKRIAGQGQKTLEQEELDWYAEIAGLEKHLRQKGTLTEANEKLLGDLKAAGIARLRRADQEKYALEITNLQGHLTRILEAEMTQTQRLKAEYQRDVANYGQAEEQKALLCAKTEEERHEIEARFEAIRGAYLTKYQTDLTRLQNSQGWRGIFGNHFAQEIRGNSDLLKQWETSTNRSLLAVQVTVESVKEAFEHMDQAMGQAIASAIVYSKSIGQAMRAAAAAELESLAARAFSDSLYWGAWALAFLCMGDLEDAALAGEAAGMFALIGGGEAMLGRAIAPKQSSSASSGAGTARGATPGPGAGGVSYGNSGGGAGPSGAGAGGPHVTINIQGHVVGTSGIQELTNMINDAVVNSDVQLTATNTRTGVQTTQ